MNFFGFDTTSVRPLNPRHANIDDKMRNSYQDIVRQNKFEKELNENAKLVEKEIKLEEAANNLVNSKRLNRKMLAREEAKLQEDLTKKCLVNFLTETTMHGLVFDRRFLRENQNNLRLKLNDFYYKMFSEGFLNTNSFKNSNNILMQEAYFDIVNKVDRAMKHKDHINIFSEDTVYNILNEADKAKDLSKDIADDVKEKVTDTLEKEKKISKKKEEEKKKDEEEKQAADSLDDDSIDNDDSDTENPDGEDDDNMDDNGGDEEGNDDAENNDEDDDMGNDDQNGNPDDSGNDMGDDSGDEAQNPEDGNPDENTDSENQDGSDGENMDDNGDDSASVESVEENPNDSNSLVITVKTNGTSVSVNANKSEALNPLLLMGHQKYNQVKKKTLFQNLMESNLREVVSTLSEEGRLQDNTIKMDGILGETVIEYTLLETLYTSKLLDLNEREIASLNKGLNFHRKSAI